MEKIVKVIVLPDYVLISEIVEIGAEVGEPDCKLINPYEIKATSLTPWLFKHTNNDTFMISSDKILTMTDPKPTLLEKYEEKTN